jgi:hypothetical protein
MNLGELRGLARLKLDDLVAPYLWSDEFLNDAINRAQDEAFVRMGGVSDDFTPQMTKAVLLAGSPFIVLNPKVLKVESVSTGLRVLVATTAAALALSSPDWEAATGVPTKYIADANSVRVYPIPLADTTATMQVRRSALTMLGNDLQIPEVPYTLHNVLLHFVLAEAYDIPDADIMNKDAAESHLKAFEGVFGPRPSAKLQSVWAKTPARSAALMRRM